MKFLKTTTLYILIAAGFFSCNNEEKAEEPQNIATEQVAAPAIEEAMLSQQQFDALDIQIDTLGTRLMSGFVEANGELEVPPQNEASVTPVVGANVADILVIEGEEVKKGEVLAYIEHPEIVKVQSDFINAYNQLEFQKKEFQRQQKLYEAGVGSGETFQRTEAQLQNARGRVAGLEAQLRQLNINPANVRNGKIQQKIPVVSPIEGAVQEVNVKTGQFVPAQTSMFEIINTHHVHVDLMVFEKDVAKVKEGQEVIFTVESLPGTELKAEILSISKNFEQDPKALHVHAEIKNKPENLVPGMYVRGKIAINNKRALALPESAIFKDGENFYAFTAEREGEAWSFRPLKVIPGTKEGGWVAIELLEEVPEGKKFAYNNAYYLMAEMHKGEGGGHHH